MRSDPPHCRSRGCIGTAPIVAASALALLLLATAAGAQDDSSAGGPARRLGVDTVSGYQDFLAADRTWPVQFVVDAFVALELAPGWQVSARPVLWRLQGGWETLLDQASIRYEARRGANWRVELGKFPAPIGLGLTENRAGNNASVLWCHRPYYMFLPSIGAALPQVSVISAVYPLGAQVAASGAKWDARGAIVDRGPVEYWKAGADAARGPNGIVGAGITPRQGMRIGAAGAWGRYANAGPERTALGYRTVNAEAEFAFGYSRLSGEWVSSRFEAPGGSRRFEAWTGQAQHTVTPRVFLHSRVTMVRSTDNPESPASVTAERRYLSVDSTLGYRVDPELTVRVAHAAVRSFGRATIDHQMGVSVIWTRRWW